MWLLSSLVGGGCPVARPRRRHLAPPHQGRARCTESAISFASRSRTKDARRRGISWCGWLLPLSRAVHVQRLWHRVQGGAAHGGHGRSRHVWLRRAAGAAQVRAGREAGAQRRAQLRRGEVPVRRRRRRMRTPRRGAVPCAAAEHRRAGAGACACFRVGLERAGKKMCW